MASYNATGSEADLLEADEIRTRLGAIRTINLSNLTADEKLEATHIWTNGRKDVDSARGLRARAAGWRLDRLKLTDLVYAALIDFAHDACRDGQSHMRSVWRDRPASGRVDGDQLRTEVRQSLSVTEALALLVYVIKEVEVTADHVALLCLQWEKLADAAAGANAAEQLARRVAGSVRARRPREAPSYEVEEIATSDQDLDNSEWKIEADALLEDIVRFLEHSSSQACQRYAAVLRHPTMFQASAEDQAAYLNCSTDLARQWKKRALTAIRSRFGSRAQGLFVD